jgi:hypothetical protein
VGRERGRRGGGAQGNNDLFLAVLATRERGNVFEWKAKIDSLRDEESCDCLRADRRKLWPAVARDYNSVEVSSKAAMGFRSDN